MKRIAVLPMDDRPVNYDYPRYLARAAGNSIQQPPFDLIVPYHPESEPGGDQRQRGAVHETMGASAQDVGQVSKERIATGDCSVQIENGKYKLLP